MSEGKDLTHISLFAGIGGIDIAAEWVGFRTILFVEIDNYCQKVLRKHWPNVPIIGDVRDVRGSDWRDVTLMTGGFPCQDISYANTVVQVEGIDGKRSGLWNEYKRLVSEIRPKYVIVENVPALLFRGLDRVLGDLSAIGYDAEWKVISASSVGAPTQRKRTFIVAYPRGKFGLNQFLLPRNCEKVDDWDKDKEKWGINREFPQMGTEALPRLVAKQPERYCNPELLRISDGISHQLDRLKALGNAVVPQQIYPILKAIADIEVLS